MSKMKATKTKKQNTTKNMQNYAPDKPTYVFFRKMLVALKRAGLTRRLGSD